MNSSSPFLFMRANILKNAGDPQEMGSFVNSCGWAVASPHWRRGPHRQGDVGPTARARTQECTQIGGNGPSVPFWGIRVHCCAVGLGCGWPWDRNSVHRSPKMASRYHFGAFVYTVATRVAIRICDASCVRWHERLSHHGVPAAPPRWPLPLGREDRL